MAKIAAVIGYGKSGAAAARILGLQGYTRVDFYDDNKRGALPVRAYSPAGYNMTVISPGIPMKLLKIMPDVYTSEIELAYSELPVGSSVIGVTGTNGKSTVTSLAAQIINNAGVSALACGNIGYTFGDAVLDNKAEIYVVELSSFQLELLHEGRFELHSAALTNLTPDHLDRYASFADYADAKLGITRFISHEGTFIAAPEPQVVNSVLRAPYKVRYIDNALEALPKLEDDRLKFEGYYVDLREFHLFGRHNVLNLACALLLAATVVNMKGDVTPLIKGLKGMPHRTETVLVKNGVTWINDSKATNVDSTLTALRSCTFPSIVLLGGKDKKGDFTLLTEELNRVSSMVITFGAAAELIYKQLEGRLLFPLVKTAGLKDAVELAHAESKIEGYTVLLSPGCASYDEFANFEERGAAFAQYVREATNV